MPFPKPKYTKKQRLKNPIPTAEDLCIVCGAAWAQTHEIFPGKNRQLSMKYKMQVRLCERHHTGDESIERHPELVKKLQKEYQQKFEDQYGHEEFMRIFGKNYL